MHTPSNSLSIPYRLRLNIVRNMKSLFFRSEVLSEQDSIKKSFEDEGIVIALLEIVNGGDTVSSCTYQISSANLRELDLGNDCHIASPWLYFMHDKKARNRHTNGSLG